MSHAAQPNNIAKLNKVSLNIHKGIKIVACTVIYLYLQPKPLYYNVHEGLKN
jgi:hypothetical protein